MILHVLLAASTTNILLIIMTIGATEVITAGHFSSHLLMNRTVDKLGPKEEKKDTSAISITST